MVAVVLRFLATFSALLCFGHASFAAMISKHAKGYENEDLPASKRLRHNLADLYLSNEISALRASTLISDAAAAHASNVADLVSDGRNKKNLARDLTRKLMKGSHWPKPYLALIPIWSKALSKQVMAEMEIWLPHEIVQAVSDFNYIEDLVTTDNIDDADRARLASIKRKLGVEQLLGLGLWLDGCPCNWDRTQSLETITMNFPFLMDNKFRIPICGIEKGFVAKGETFDCILEIIAWSLTLLGEKQWPTCRHDGSPWNLSDGWRSKKSSLDVRAVLMEVRGDWDMFKKIFRFPQHNEVKGICFKCTAKPADIRRPSSEATWRNEENRLTIWSLIQRMLDQGLKPSPLLGAPFVSIDTFRIDWLHAVDLGVLPDFLGNLFHYIVEHKLVGDNRKQKVGILYALIVEFYKSHPEVESRLDNLTPEMIRSKAVAPKLRAKAAEARGLVEFAVGICKKFLDEEVPFEQALKMAAHHMALCYSCLTEKSIFSEDLLRENCRRFCLLYVALSDASENPIFRVKPKMHMFQELCEMGGASRPVLHWTYRDEDFGGFVAKLARRRGGKHSVAAQSRAILRRFAGKYRIPRFHHKE
jgi:hypothetical protein